MYKFESKNYHKLRREKEIAFTIYKLRIIIARKQMKKIQIFEREITLNIHHRSIRVIKLESWMREFSKTIKSLLESKKHKLKLELTK